MSQKQLSLIEQFDKTTRKRELLIEKLVSFINNLKYIRTCTAFAFTPPLVKEDRMKNINHAMHYLAILTFRLSRGVAKWRTKDYQYFSKLTEDGGFVNMTEAKSDEELIEFYKNNAKRIRTLLLINREIMGNDIEIGTHIVQSFDKLYRSHAIQSS
jgi:hypothetical protein